MYEDGVPEIIDVEFETVSERRAQDAEYEELDGDFGSPSPADDIDSQTRMKGMAQMIGGAAIAAAGIPLCILPGPGLAVIAGGVAMAGKGYTDYTGKQPKIQQDMEMDPDFNEGRAMGEKLGADMRVVIDERVMPGVKRAGAAAGEAAKSAAHATGAAAKAAAPVVKTVAETTADVAVIAGKTALDAAKAFISGKKD